MSSYTGLSPKGPNHYVGPNVYLPTLVTRTRSPTGADYRQPETGKLYPTGSYWLTGASPTTGTQGDLWYLSKIVANVAYWVMIGASPFGPLLSIVVPSGVTTIVPDGSGIINFTSTLGTITITGSSASPNNHTINFDLAGGSVSIDSIGVQAITAPGVTPVLPTAGGLMTVSGNAVSNHSVPVETRSRALNAYNIEVQYATSAAATDATKSGLAHFNSSQFSVDANGFVALTGGGAAIDSIGVDATSGGGTNPVLPTAGGLITVNGALVAAGTNPIRSVSTAANVYQIQVQTSQALASADSTKVGLSNFKNTDFSVDANGFVSSLGNMVMTGIINIGFSYNAGTGTFTVHAQDGTALSASNPGYVTLQDPAAFGELITITVTSNQDFIDDNGASQIIGNLFGLTTGIAITVDIPFFLYAVLNDALNSVAFMISRFPNSTVAPVAAKIGMPSTAVADSQGSFFSLENITAADYENNPCISIGSFRMRMSASDDWTVQTLAARDGIGHFQEGIQFSFPRGQFGAASNKVFKNNGGTAPDDADGGYTYYVDSDNNRIFFQLAYPAIDTAGVGAVTLQLALPYIRIEGATAGSGFLSTGGAYAFVMLEVIPSTNTIQFPQVNPSTSALTINSDIIIGEAVSLNGTIAILFT